MCFVTLFFVTEVAEFFFVDTTPLVDHYFTDPGDHVYDWRDILPRKQYISNLLKVLATDHSFGIVMKMKFDKK